ncbi:MAG: hypothetical protein FJX46_05460 [Alphaproteobacteria bacterium]|nr:hypothetical protein [Alphaproteobacteria bacterium]
MLKGAAVGAVFMTAIGFWGGASPSLTGIMAGLGALAGALARREHKRANDNDAARASAERRLAEERAGRETAIAAGEARLIAALPDPALLLAAEGTVRLANAPAREVLGFDPAGQPIAAVLRDPGLQAAVRAALAGASAEAELRLADRVAQSILARLRPLPGGALVVLADQTALKRAEQVRADFVANASHEIRTPLATLSGLIETLRGPAKDDAPARERFLALAGEQAGRITRLVQDLLSLSRIEVDENQPPTARVDLGPLLERAVALSRHAAEARSVTLQPDIAPDLPPVRADAGQLEQVFHNLIDNAVVYGGDGKTVRVLARRADAGVAVTVEDQGSGIAREHLPRLTERFYRIDAARSRQAGGTGLGLAIVKHIVNRHKGRLTIDSEPGRGSRFTVALPTAE